MSWRRRASILIAALAIVGGCRSREPATRSSVGDVASPLAPSLRATLGDVPSSRSASAARPLASSAAEVSGSSALSRHPRLDHPIVLGGSIAGQAYAGHFTPIDEKLLSRVDIPESQSSVPAPFVRVPPKLRFYSATGAVGDATPVRARVALGCAAAPELGFDYGGAEPPRGAWIGLEPAWDAMPRRPTSVSDHGPWLPKIEALLEENGKPDAPVEIQRVDRVDLAGDGRPELVISAHHVEWRPRCRAPSRGAECTAGGEEAFEMAKSYGLVVVALDGEGPLRILHRWLEGVVTTASPPAYVDTDADGTLEIVIESRYYEGQSFRVVQLAGGEVRTVLTGGCGL